jgi:hypothetical protein
MSWIQENRFAAGLGGITAVAAAGLIAWGVSAGKKYGAAKEAYTAAADAVSSMEGEKLYPNDDNRQAKEKAVKDYEAAVDGLQKAFKPFASATPPNIEPDQFNENLLKAKEVVAKAFADAGCEIPGEFFLGYEAFTNSPVKKEATGILSYEMEGIGQLLTYLAASNPVKLLNIHRPQLAEEEGGTFDAKDKSFRALPVELSFTGTEASLRAFLSSLDDSEKFYYVVRSMRVMNEKTTAPTAADGQFKTDEAEEPAAGGDAFPDAGGFVLPGEEPAAEAPAEGEKPAEEAAPAGDTGAILQQVLGSEKINVFLRIDIVQFLQSPKA